LHVHVAISISGIQRRNKSFIAVRWIPRQGSPLCYRKKLLVRSKTDGPQMFYLFSASMMSNVTVLREFVGAVVNEIKFWNRTFTRENPDLNTYNGNTLENLFAAERLKMAADQRAANIQRNEAVKKRRAANRNIVNNLEKKNDL